MCLLCGRALHGVPHGGCSPLEIFGLTRGQVRTGSRPVSDSEPVRCCRSIRRFRRRGRHDSADLAGHGDCSTPSPARLRTVSATVMSAYPTRTPTAPSGMPIMPCAAPRPKVGAPIASSMFGRRRQTLASQAFDAPLFPAPLRGRQDARRRPGPVPEVPRMRGRLSSRMRGASRHFVPRIEDLH